MREERYASYLHGVSNVRDLSMVPRPLTKLLSYTYEQLYSIDVRFNYLIIYVFIVRPSLTGMVDTSIVHMYDTYTHNE